MGKRKICVVTGTRAEYGLLYWLMKEIEADSSLELQIVTTGMHLSPEFGLTYKTIEKDGFVINEKVEMLLSSDTTVGITKSLGLGIIGFADAFSRLNPDIIVILGDRFEILAAAQAAMIARIPIAHLHGGERSEGAIDESIRHSVTKMAQLHFVAAEKYRQTVIQLGENPNNVFNFGALGIENINRLKLLSKKELEEIINFRFGNINFLVTYHPATLENKSSSEIMTELFNALDFFPEAKIIFTKPNADADGRVISYMIDEYAARFKDRVYVTNSLGQINYLSAIQYMDVVIGNSSSGIIEVPFFKKPTINIGNRQKGRIKAKSIIDSRDSKLEIINAINLALSKPFRESLKEVESLYGEGSTSKKIKEVLKSTDINQLVYKKFFDI